MNKTKTLTILIGPPASGKTTYALEQVRKNSDNLKRVNMDDLRFMATNYKYTRENEQYIFNLRNMAIRSALKRGFDVISDDTNLPGKTRKGLHKIAEEIGNVTVNEKFFDISLPEALRRDANRTKSVGDDIVKKFYKKYINRNFKLNPPTYYPPVKSENFNTLIQDTSLPKAIMCDIDGTAAKMVTRGPYEWDKVKEDIVNTPVIEIIRKFYKDGYKILFLTAREGQAEELTREWLTENDVPYHKLFIKPSHDSRKDTINKREIFDKNIRDRYNVLFVMDDRDQVVKLWRDEIGLTCLQVDWGNF